jgi:hypothetical protein
MFMVRVPLPPLVIGECSSLCLSTMEEARMDEATMEQATIKEQMNAEVLDMTTFTLYNGRHNCQPTTNLCCNISWSTNDTKLIS